MTNRFLCKQLDFLLHTRGKPLILVLGELRGCKLLSRNVRSKKGKQKSELRQLEKSVLSYARILIHRFSNNREVNWRIRKITIVFLMTMTEHKHFKKLDISVFFLRRQNFFEKSWLGLFNILFYKIRNWLLLAFRSAQVEKGFKRRFVVKSHRPKACSFKIKVELHVLFVLFSL